MNTKIGASIAVCAIVMFLKGNIAAYAQLTMEEKLAQIDRTFVCPESLPTDEARNDAVKLFLEQFLAVQSTTTLQQLGDFRVAMLRKHECRATLANIDGPANAKAAPATRSTDHWERAGSISGPQGMVVTVDMDSMTSAGPGRTGPGRAGPDADLD